MEMDALIAHTNAFLRGGEPMPNWRDLPGFENVEEFAIGLFWNRSKTFSTLKKWGDWLKDTKVHGARLFVPTNKSAGGRMETNGERGQMKWSFSRTVLREIGPIDPWPLGYIYSWRSYGEDLDPAISRLFGSIQEGETALRTAHEEVVEFCLAQDRDEWADHFRISLDVLEGKTPLLHQEALRVFPKQGYGTDAKRLYCAALAANGFLEGKSFWRDELFRTSAAQEQFRAVTERYAEATSLARVAALDSYESPTP